MKLWKAVLLLASVCYWTAAAAQDAEPPGNLRFFIDDDVYRQGDEQGQALMNEAPRNSGFGGMVAELFAKGTKVSTLEFDIDYQQGRGMMVLTATIGKDNYKYIINGEAQAFREFPSSRDGRAISLEAQANLAGLPANLPKEVAQGFPWHVQAQGQGVYIVLAEKNGVARPLSDPIYDRVWRNCLHLGSNKEPPSRGTLSSINGYCLGSCTWGTLFTGY